MSSSAIHLRPKLFRYRRDFDYLIYVEDKTGSSVATTRAWIKLTDGKKARYINVPNNGPQEIARYNIEFVIKCICFMFVDRTFSKSKTNQISVTQMLLIFALDFGPLDVSEERKV